MGEIFRLASEQDWWGRSGGCTDLFRLILDKNQSQKWGVLPGLTADQNQLTKKLDAIARDAQRLWLLRAINGMTVWKELPPDQADLPPTPAMSSRLSVSGRKLRASVVSHAEEVLLDAVLEPSQRTEIKRRLWINRGVRALLDPELAATLYLAKWQRQSIGLMLEDRAAFRRKSNDILIADLFRIHGARDKGALLPEEVNEQVARARRSFDQRMANSDAPIWDILSTAQSRTLAKILRQPIPKKEDEKTKKKSSRAG